MTYQLTRKDRDILFELSMHARISITQLAKKVKLSKQVVSYRLKKLEKDKAILGYYAITNIYMLGRTHYRIFVKFQNMSSEKEEEFMKYLVKHPRIVWAVYYDGGWDTAFLTWEKNIREFEKVYDEISERFGIYFQDVYFSIGTKIEYLRYKFLNNAKDSSSLVFGDCYSDYELDELDKRILMDLNQNGRMTLVELANKYDTSAKVIRARIGRMLERRIIIGFNVKINHNLIGYTHRKVLLKLNDSSKEKIGELSTYLRSHKNTIYMTKPIGHYNFEFELMTESNEEFHNIIKELRSRFAGLIQSYISVIHYSEPKSGQLYEF